MPDSPDPTVDSPSPSGRGLADLLFDESHDLTADDFADLYAFLGVSKRRKFSPPVRRQPILPSPPRRSRSRCSHVGRPGHRRSAASRSGAPPGQCDDPEPPPRSSAARIGGAA